MINGLVIAQKEDVDLFTSSTSLRYRQTPDNHIRVKAHAIGMSINFYS